MKRREHKADAQGFVNLSRRVMALKSVPRTGWLDRGVDPHLVESVADHSLGVAVLAWAGALARKAQGAELDPTRVLMLALMHDLAEAVTGDEPPYDPASLPGAGDPRMRRAFLERRHIRDEAREAAKRASEDSVMRELLGKLPEAVRATLGGLWHELRQGTSQEALFVKQADRLETFLQSRRYRESDPDLPIDSFRQEVLEKIDDPLLAGIRDAVLEMASPTRSPSHGQR